MRAASPDHVKVSPASRPRPVPAARGLSSQIPRFHPAPPPSKLQCRPRGTGAPVLQDRDGLGATLPPSFHQHLFLVLGTSAKCCRRTVCLFVNLRIFRGQLLPSPSQTASITRSPQAPDAGLPAPEPWTLMRHPDSDLALAEPGNRSSTSHTANAGQKGVYPTPNQTKNLLDLNFLAPIYLRLYQAWHS